MCFKCEECERKITHYRQLAGRVLDTLMLEGVSKLIEELERTKAALHSAPGRKNQAAVRDGLVNVPAPSSSSSPS